VDGDGRGFVGGGGHGVGGEGGVETEGTADEAGGRPTRPRVYYIIDSSDDDEDFETN